MTSQTKMWNLVDARLHLRPYSNPLFDVAVPAVASPSGPRLAGKYGVGLLSIGATQAAGFDALGLHWDVMEERAATFGTVADRVEVAPRRADAHRRDQGAGRPGRRVRHPPVVRLLPAHRRVPADGRRRRRRGAGDDRLRQRLRARLDRHRRDGVRADRAPAGAVRRVRLLHVPGPRVGQPGGDQAQLRADRPARLPRVPGPRRHDARAPRRGPGRAGSTSPSAT